MNVPVHETFVPQTRTRWTMTLQKSKKTRTPTPPSNSSSFSTMSPPPPPVDNLIYHTPRQQHDDSISHLTHDFDTTVSYDSATTSTRSVGLNPYYGPISVGGIPNHDLARRWTQPKSHPQTHTHAHTRTHTLTQTQTQTPPNVMTPSLRSTRDKVQLVGNRRNRLKEQEQSVPDSLIGVKVGVGITSSSITSGVSGGSPETISSQKVHLGTNGMTDRSSSIHDQVETEDILVKTLQTAVKTSSLQKKEYEKGEEEEEVNAPTPPPMVQRKRYSGSQFQFSPKLSISSSKRTRNIPTANINNNNHSSTSSTSTRRSVLALPSKHTQNPLSSSTKQQSKKNQILNAPSRTSVTTKNNPNHTDTIIERSGPTHPPHHSKQHKTHKKQSFLNRLSQMNKRGHDKCSSSQGVVDLDCPPSSTHTSRRAIHVGRTTMRTRFSSPHNSRSNGTGTSFKGTRRKKDIWAPDANDVFVHDSDSDNEVVAADPPSCLSTKPMIRRLDDATCVDPIGKMQVKKFKPRNKSLRENEIEDDQDSDLDSLLFLSITNRDDDDDSLLLFLSKGNEKTVGTTSGSKTLLSGDRSITSSDIQIQHQQSAMILDDDFNSLCYSESNGGTYFSASTMEGINPGIAGASHHDFELSEVNAAVIAQSIGQSRLKGYQSETIIRCIDQEREPSQSLAEKMRVNEEEHAAICIQAIYRGFISRFQLLKEVGLFYTSNLYYYYKDQYHSHF